MAILWEKKQAGNHYQVRTAGASKRLYKNRVCHSQYHPDRIMTGSIWDLLLIGACIHPANVRRVLVLGVGGGAVLRQIQYFLNPKIIIGVELDAVHIDMAQRFFDLDDSVYQLEIAEAQDWVHGYNGKPFDIIIDDVFTDKKGSPVRALAATSSWFRLLNKHLARDGVLIMNFASRMEFRISAAASQVPVNHLFESIFLLTSPTLDNHVGVYTHHTETSEGVRDKLEQFPEIMQAIQTGRTKYRIRKQRKL